LRKVSSFLFETRKAAILFMEIPLKKNLLFFTPIFPPYFSGATRQALTLARELRERSWGISFLTLREQQDTDKRLYFTEKFDGFRLVVVPVTNYHSLIEGGYGRLASLLLILRLFLVCFKIRSHFTIFHSHICAFPFSAMGILGKLSGKMTIAKITMSDELDLKNIGRLMGRLHKLFTCSFDYLVSMSDEIEKSLSETSISAEKIVHIPNSVNTSLFTPITSEHREALKRKLQLPDGFIFISVGGITYRKGMDTLVQNWFEFNKKTPGTTLVLLGPRSEDEGAMGDKYCYKEIVDFVDHNNLTQNIFIPGNVSNVHNFLQCADMFILTSQREGMPNVILEAMACGVPVISTPVSGIGNIITSGENGEILNSLQNQKPLELIEKLYTDEYLRVKYSKAGLLTINEKFSLSHIASLYETVYARMLSTPLSSVETEEC
jgi:glycosyltransferase involved in cell wall biosynthesis